MNKDQNNQLVRIATALGHEVLEISPAFYGSDFGRLELRNRNDGYEFSWNPLTHAGDRYELLQTLGMAVDFSGKRAVAKLALPTGETATASFSKKDGTEAQAIVGLADKWAQSKVTATAAVASA